MEQVFKFEGVSRMCRFLFSAVSVVGLLITTFLLPQPALACDERMPLTLLALYRTSDAIYVGRYEKTVDGEVTEETDDYRAVPITKHFSISSALKGDSRKMLTIADTEYRYKNQEVAVAEDESEHGGSEVDNVELVSGDSVLLFLKKNEESDELELTEITDGIKKMTPAKLSAYEARIGELKSIFSTEKPKHSQIVEWLVRTAEDPNTRWEGSFELMQSFYNMEWQEERAKLAKEKPDQDEYVPETPKEFETGDPEFARNLTENQKRALTDVLLNREQPAENENGAPQSKMAHGDRELIDLVKRWGDSNVAANLLEQLRQGSSDTSFSSELMGSISSMLQDDELGTLFSEYANVQWEVDEDVIADDTEVAEAAPEVAPVDQPQPVGGPELIPVEPVEGAAELAESPVVESAEPEKKKKTYGELRGELMTKFIARADKVVAREQSKESAKLNR